jgi:hypothetical protein
LRDDGKTTGRQTEGTYEYIPTVFCAATDADKERGRRDAAGVKGKRARTTI